MTDNKRKWSCLCQQANKIKDPDGRSFGSYHLSGAIKKYLGANPYGLTERQEQIIKEWFALWERGRWKNYKTRKKQK